MEEGNLTIRVELPGIDPKDITVDVVGDMLTIRASRQEEHETRSATSFTASSAMGPSSA
ncbi:MAG: Hsp20/alpha crystallin family protein [Candidatus Binataceae bacterium]